MITQRCPKRMRTVGNRSYNIGCARLARAFYILAHLFAVLVLTTGQETGAELPTKLTPQIGLPD